MTTDKLVVSLIAIAMLSACTSADYADTNKPPNFLILIGDDMGVETLPCYDVGSAPAKTPTLDSLCNSGMRFDNFWSQPLCSPTRATMLTGQYGFRNGVGVPAKGPNIDFPVPDADVAVEEISGRGDGRRRGDRLDGGQEQASRPSLSSDAYGLPAALKADRKLNYQTAALGKWHLGNDKNGALEHPQRVGFDHYAGPFNEGGVESFFAWSKVVNGTLTDGETGYVTTNTVDDAINWLSGRDSQRPWLVWVAFNAAHSPWGPPPAALLSDETADALANADNHTLFRAMIEAMDTEIGRLLREIPNDELDNTYVVFIGDNGTPNPMASAPYESGRVKASLYQGGINVPFIVSGPKIHPGSTTPALANSVDVFSTILDLAGTAVDDKLNGAIIDGVSLAPVLHATQHSVREFAYADLFGKLPEHESDSQTIRDDRYKLIRNRLKDSVELYDLSTDPFESQQLAIDELSDVQVGRYESLLQRLDAMTAVSSLQPSD